MKNFFFIVLILSFGLAARSQKSMYLYFESENQAPFYLKIDDKVFTSVAPGYYILSGLREGKYKLSIGIPSESRLENRFEIDINGRDRGLIIKRQGDGLILQDMHDGTSVRYIKDPSQPSITYEARSDAFTVLLSKASGDPGLLMSPVFASVQKTEPVVSSNSGTDSPSKNETAVGNKTESEKPNLQVQTVKIDSASVVAEKGEKQREEKAVVVDNPPKNIEVTELKTELAKAEVETQTDLLNKKETENAAQIESDPYRKTRVSKFAESSTSEGFNLVYLDDVGELKDTIRILIPNPKYNLVNAEIKEKQDPKFLELKEEREGSKPVIPVDSIKGKPEASPLLKDKKDEQVAEILPTVKDSSAEKSVKLSGDSKSTVNKNNCKDHASDNDFFRIRKNMASEITDEAMVAEAKKIFRNKCFQTEQIKYLSSLFLTSAGKYLFFDAAYLHVSDPEQFASLQGEIKDEYYKKRFNALVGL